VTAPLRALVAAAWEGEGPLGWAAGGLLAPAAWPYAGVVALRNRLYDRGDFAAHRVGARVVSVGNLTVGGSGKTPLVLWLADELARRGRRVAIVARGYRKRRPGVVVVGTEGVARVSAADGGDEAVLLARRFAGPVVVGEDRVAAAAFACREFAADVLVLDDGFQHRRLARDLDVVVLGSDPRRQRLLPAGPLREGASALGRAGTVVVMDAAVRAEDLVGAETPVVRATTVPTGLVTVAGGRWDVREPGELAGRGIAAVAGIARPQRFLDALEKLGARVRETRLLDDHHTYGPADAAWIAAAARRGPVVTTEKDLVKLVELGATGGVAALRIGVEVTPAEVLVRLAAGEDVVCGTPAREEVTT
jgi:tetraacyldisaccharide 4'-kinase